VGGAATDVETAVRVTDSKSNVDAAEPEAVVEEEAVVDDAEAAEAPPDASGVEGGGGGPCGCGCGDGP